MAGFAQASADGYPKQICLMAKQISFGYQRGPQRDLFATLSHQRDLKRSVWDAFGGVPEESILEAQEV